MTRWVVGVLALGLLVGACAPEPPPAPPPTVAVYGDSLTSQARIQIEQRITALLPDHRVEVHAYPGTAQCDWHQQMRDDAAAETVRAVVISFTGNDFTPCITGRDTVDAYTEDAQWAVDFWRAKGVPLLFVAGPTRVGTLPADDAVGTVYRTVGASRSVLVVDPASLFVDETGRYAQFMPCLVGECAGWIEVRNDDGVHFCPSGTFTDGSGCGVYASGTVRFAEAIVHGVAALVGVAQPPYRTMITPPSTAALSTTPATSPVTVPGTTPTTPTTVTTPTTTPGPE